VIGLAFFGSGFLGIEFSYCAFTEFETKASNLCHRQYTAELLSRCKACYQSGLLIRVN